MEARAETAVVTITRERAAAALADLTATEKTAEMGERQLLAAVQGAAVQGADQPQLAETQPQQIPALRVELLKMGLLAVQALMQVLPLIRALMDQAEGEARIKRTREVSEVLELNLIPQKAAAAVAAVADLTGPLEAREERAAIMGAAVAAAHGEERQRAEEERAVTAS